MVRQMLPLHSQVRVRAIRLLPHLGFGCFFCLFCLVSWVFCDRNCLQSLSTFSLGIVLEVRVTMPSLIYHMWVQLHRLGAKTTTYNSEARKIEDLITAMWDIVTMIDYFLFQLLALALSSLASVFCAHQMCVCKTISESVPFLPFQWPTAVLYLCHKKSTNDQVQLHFCSSLQMSQIIICRIFSTDTVCTALLISQSV